MGQVAVEHLKSLSDPSLLSDIRSTGRHNRPESQSLGSGLRRNERSAPRRRSRAAAGVGDWSLLLLVLLRRRFNSFLASVAGNDGNAGDGPLKWPCSARLLASFGKWNKIMGRGETERWVHKNISPGRARHNRASGAEDRRRSTIWHYAE